MVEVSGETMYYVFGDEDTDDFSKEFLFNVPPAAGKQPLESKGRGTRVILFDDLGRGSMDSSFTWYEYGRPSIFTTEAVGNEIVAGTVDAIYHGGDISYATGFLAVWDFFLDMLTPMSAHVIYLTTVGNHESDWTDSASLYNVVRVVLCCMAPLCLLLCALFGSPLNPVPSLPVQSRPVQRVCAGWGTSRSITA